MSNSTDNNAEYHVNSERQLIEDVVITIYSICDSDGIPVNYGHFTNEDEAAHCCNKMNYGKFHGDHVSGLCQSYDSCTHTA